MLKDALEYLSVGIGKDEVIFVEKELYRETGGIKEFLIELVVELFDWDNVVVKNERFKRIY